MWRSAKRRSRSTATIGLAVGLVGLSSLASFAEAASDTAQAVYEQAARYHHGEGVAKNLTRALQLYCQAGRAGHADAMFKIGWMFLNGRETSQHDGQGVAWLAAAARAGHPTAGNVLKMLDGVAPASVRRCPVAPNENRSRDVDTPVTAEMPLPLEPPPEIEALAQRIGAEYNVAPELVLAVIAVESAWQPHAVSHAGAQGLMQLIPETAARFGVLDPFDPEQNVRGGTQYLRWLLSLFRGDVTRVLAAYNAGEGAVIRHKGIPPYTETQEYVVKVRRYYSAITHPFDPTVAQDDSYLQIGQKQ